MSSSNLVKIPLTKGFSAIIDKRDDWLLNYMWHAKIVSHNYVYAGTSQYSKDFVTKTRICRLHNIVWEINNGSVPEGYTVDHIQQGEWGALDNRLENLRLATKRQQQINRRAEYNSTSQYRGISLHASGKWMAQATDSCGIYVYVGLFSDEIEAALAVDRANYIMHKNYVNLNFPEFEHQWANIPIEDLHINKRISHSLYTGVYPFNYKMK